MIKFNKKEKVRIKALANRYQVNLADAARMFVQSGISASSKPKRKAVCKVWPQCSCIVQGRKSDCA